jgi:WD40 repeat protein
MISCESQLIDLLIAERVKRDADICERDTSFRMTVHSRWPAALLDSLRPVASAVWNADIPTTLDQGASTCTPGTRVSILKDLLAWAGASDSPCVFWLNGLAGTGKSTIARTFCQRLHEQGLLGASFFVSRDQPDRRDASNVVRSIAHQLALRWRPVSDALCARLRDNPTSATRSLQEQIADFVVASAHELQGPHSFIIVIDALDECFSDVQGRPGGDLLLLLVRHLLQLGDHLRLFLTSRVEIRIQHVFRELSATSQTSVFKLHELDAAVVRGDIITYLTHSFSRIRADRLELALGEWPPSEDVHQLAELSGLLFIYAATAVRFVNDLNYSPRRRLAQLLGRGQSFTGTSAYGPLDALYRRILSDAVRGSGGDEDFLCQRLQAVVAVIILAQTLVHVEALSTLAGLDPDDANIVVGSLSSLLTDSVTGVRVFHPSFPDFVLDAARCTDPRLHVVPTVDHGIIALRCMELMNRLLRYDICDIQDPTIANKDVSGLDARLRENVSGALRYAVSFWCNHLAASGPPSGSLLDALDELCRKHLFHWLELLSLLECVPPAETALLKVIKWCEVRDSSTSRGKKGSDACSSQKDPSSIAALAMNILRDVTRALQFFASPIRSHALHAYHSALLTMPQCLLQKTLGDEHLPSGLPRLVSPRAAHWGLSPRVLEGDSDEVACIAYSPNGAHIVSGSIDRTVRVWNAITFEQIITLKGHQGGVNCVTFSFDGTCIASGSNDLTVRIWNTDTFEKISELKGHQGKVYAVAFSPNGTRIVTASNDRTVLVWDAVTFTQIAKLESHQGGVSSVTFSHVGTHIVSGSFDCTVRIWNAVTFEQVAKLEGHQDWVRSVALSHDDTRIVSGSDDGTVRVWNACTFQQLAKLDGHKGDVSCAEFSSDDTRIVSGSHDHTVYVWSADSFKPLAKLEGHHGHVNAVTFSPDGTQIVSGSDDRTMRVWNAVTFAQLAALEGHEVEVRSIALSPDGTRIASGSRDYTVRIWNAVNFKQLAKLTGHRGLVNSVAFSAEGARIVSGSADGTACVWDAVTFQQLAKLMGHRGWVYSVAFSPDTTGIISGSGDGIVRVWDAVSFEQLASLKSHDGTVVFVSFSLDSKVIFARDRDGEQRSWISRSSDGSTWSFRGLLATLTKGSHMEGAISSRASSQYNLLP